MSQKKKKISHTNKYSKVKRQVVECVHFVCAARLNRQRGTYGTYKSFLFLAMIHSCKLQCSYQDAAALITETHLSLCMAAFVYMLFLSSRLQIPITLHKEKDYNEEGREVLKCGFKIGGGIDQDYKKSPQGYTDYVSHIKFSIYSNYSIVFSGYLCDGGAQRQCCSKSWPTNT